MTTLARTLQSVRPHVPLIRFPTRKMDAAAGSAVNMVQTDIIKPASTPATPSNKPAIGSTPRGSGVEDVPLRFQRRSISLEEMEHIERGGPE